MTLFFLRSCVAVIYGVTALNAVVNYLTWQMGTWQLYMGMLLLLAIANCALVSIVHIIVKRFLCILNIENAESPPPIIGFYCVKREDQVY